MAAKRPPAPAGTLPVGFVYSVDAQKGLLLRAEQSAVALQEQAAHDQEFQKRLIRLLRSSQKGRAIPVRGRTKTAPGKLSKKTTSAQELERLLEAALGSRA